MSARLVKDPTNSEAKYIPISSTAFTVGSILELDVGATAWTIANASTEHWQRKAVCIETSTTSDTEIKAIMVNDLQTWEVDTDNNSNSSHNGDRMLLSATAGKVNNAGTDDTSEEACFVQEAPVGAAADKKIIGKFVGGTGINPDAT